MTHNLVLILVSTAEKPGLTKRDTLTIARRVLRHICQVRRTIQGERHELRSPT